MKTENLLKIIALLEDNNEPDHNNGGSSPYIEGHNYLIETVTKYYTGRLVGVGPTELTIDRVAWIPNTGPYSKSFTSGFSETQPLPEGQSIIGRGAIIHARIITLQLPTEIK